jgi:hypothetical protein
MRAREDPRVSFDATLAIMPIKVAIHGGFVWAKSVCQTLYYLILMFSLRFFDRQPWTIGRMLERRPLVGHH